jgi:Trk-type K+ transport system membrane component
MISSILIAIAVGACLGTGLASLANRTTYNREEVLMKAYVRMLRESWDNRNQSELNYMALQKACRKLSNWEYDQAKCVPHYWIEKVRKESGWNQEVNIEQEPRKDS